MVRWEGYRVTSNLLQPAAGTTCDAKAWATAQARCALLGITATRTEADNGRPLFIVTKWALTRSFESLPELAAWLDQVEGIR